MKLGWLPSKANQIYFSTNLFFLHPGWSAFAQESARPALDRRTTPPPCPRWTPPPCPPPPPRTCGTCGQCPTFPSPGWASPSPWGRGPGNGRATLTGSLLIFWISSIFSRQYFKSEHWFDPLHSLTDELLVKILAYLTSKELMGVARWRSSKYKLQHILLNNSISLGPRPTISKPIYQTTGAIPCIAFTTNDDFDPGCKAAQKFYRKKHNHPSGLRLKISSNLEASLALPSNLYVSQQGQSACPLSVSPWVRFPNLYYWLDVLYKYLTWQLETLSVSPDSAIA